MARAYRARWTHLVDHVVPPLSVRQWVLAVPKRLRWYLEREPRALSAVALTPEVLAAIAAQVRQRVLRWFARSGLLEAADAPAQMTTSAVSAPGARTARYHWAILLARRFATVPLRCPQCGAEPRLIAFATAAEPVASILTHVGEPAEPPPIAPARGPRTARLG
jgi:hypothetical protein